MASHREGAVNPLRPYYVPPSIGEPADGALTGPGPNPFRGGNSTMAAGGPRYASKARDLFSDIDYKGYISEPSPSAVQTVKELLDEALWKYMSVLMAQPFEVAKTILQVRVQEGGAPTTPAQTPAEESKHRRAPSIYDPAPDSDSEGDEPSYFTSNVPSTPTPRAFRQRTTPPLDSPRHAPSRSSTSFSAAVGTSQLLIRKPDSVMEVISQLWQKEGTWGVWKASNATFVYSALQSLLENWSRSLLSALFDVPDLGVRADFERLVDIASPYPWASFLVAAGAAVATGLILAPLDLVRTRLILTSVSRQPRRSMTMLRNLPSYLCPSSLVLPTILHSLVHPILTLSTPLMLRTRFGIDREISPTSFSVSKFCSSTVALFIKLPLETVLRRGQAAVLSRPQFVEAMDPAKATTGGILDAPPATLETIVPCGKYDGLLGTMKHIVYSEGTRPAPPRTKAPTSSSTKRSKTPKAVEAATIKGQGMEGLWRGWKVSWWGLVGLWTAGVLGGGGDGEF